MKSRKAYSQEELVKLQKDALHKVVDPMSGDSQPLANVSVTIYGNIIIQLPEGRRKKGTVK